MVNDIQELIPTSAPLLTYMGNKFTSGGNYTPYSFISALPSSEYPDISTGNRMIINKWMADDLRATKGDTVTLTWYSPESPSKLAEVSNNFHY